MPDLTRRDLLRASAGAAAVAVPFSALSASSGGTAAAASAATMDDAADTELGSDLAGPIMFCVRDVARGEVSILHGTEEVVVNDRQLVNRIIKAATARRAV